LHRRLELLFRERLTAVRERLVRPQLVAHVGRLAPEIRRRERPRFAGREDDLARTGRARSTARLNEPRFSRAIVTSPNAGPMAPTSR